MPWPIPEDLNLQLEVLPQLTEHDIRLLICCGARCRKTHVKIGNVNTKKNSFEDFERFSARTCLLLTAKIVGGRM
jgi:hypothetical protein